MNSGGSCSLHEFITASKAIFMRLLIIGCLILGVFQASAPAAPEAALPIRPGADFPFDPSRRHDRDFRPSGALMKLSEHLFVLDDTCRVYVIKSGDRGLLVGFGSGRILGKMSDLGIQQVDRVLLTHHHRNQAQGLVGLKAYPFKVTVPEKEAIFFENVESFWRDVKLYINYDCRSYWNTLRQSIRVDEKVRAGSLISWQGYEFKVLETPGPTDHSVSYSTKIDGRRVVFCGDLISGAGKVPNWFDLHWDYYGFTQGIDASDLSFAEIRGERAEWLLPSHGDPIHNPSAAMEANSKVYAQLREMLVPNELSRVDQEIRQICPHLVYVGATCYAILSDSGKAFLWDYGYVDRDRVEELKERFKVKRIDAVSFSHYHDDHIIRAWELLRENSKFWVYENMLDIFENPTRFRLPCLIPFPIKADRVLHDEEKVRWEEYEFEFFHLPGQTEFHQGLSTVIDGRKVLFTGDNTWNKKDPAKTRNGPLVPHNEYFLDGGFIACSRKMLEIMPDLVCPAHTEEYSPNRQDLEEFLGWAYRLRDLMTGLIDQPDPNFGMDVRWCHFYPYRSVVTGPGEFEVELLVRNHLYKPANLEIELKLPTGLICSTPARRFAVEAKKSVRVPFILRKTTIQPGKRSLVTADVTINGRRLGEYAEALVD
jgi:glyoxylase-like metal-dependent hydrolase (beta-lactamase superfamily II)